VGLLADQAGWLGSRPALVLYSSDEPGELLQWQCHDDITVNIVVCWYAAHTLYLALSESDTPSKTLLILVLCTLNEFEVGYSHLPHYIKYLLPSFHLGWQFMLPQITYLLTYYCCVVC